MFISGLGYYVGIGLIAVFALFGMFAQGIMGLFAGALIGAFFFSVLRSDIYS